jgi:hypothetical protein
VARDALRDVKDTDPVFWNELTAQEKWEEALPDKTETLLEDEALLAAENNDKGLDDSEIPLKMVISSVIDGEVPSGLAPRENGSLISISNAKSLDESQTIELSTGTGAASTSRPSRELGPGKRKRVPNHLYRTKDFWWHNVGDKSNVEAEEWEDEAV